MAVSIITVRHLKSLDLSIQVPGSKRTHASEVINNRQQVKRKTRALSGKSKPATMLDLIRALRAMISA